MSVNKRILITGGTKGIGRAIAERFAAEGFDVAVCARTDQDLLKMQTAFSKRFPDCTLVTGVVDVRQKHELLAFVEHILDTWGTIDVLVNNAGVFIPGALSEEPEGALETMIETNLYSAYHVTRAVLPVMTDGKKRHIFNMCSVASLFAYPNGGSYSISKFALLGFSKVLREELKQTGLRVTSVLPGATWSASWEGIDLPIERLMPAADVAAAVWNAWNMSDATVVEEILLRPQLGDLQF